mmetsp:Transcript_38069/g.77468  ORF Transcript_38069/g.77468 Transcript_38069/m.77468 type:complete len:209 (-) Transcript_38069:119-745(-)
MGNATHSPSGMLWMPIAMARTAPTPGSSRAATKVASPSGKLCMPIASAVLIPIRTSFLLSRWAMSTVTLFCPSRVPAFVVEFSSATETDLDCCVPAASAGAFKPSPLPDSILSLSSKVSASSPSTSACASLSALLALAPPPRDDGLDATVSSRSLSFSSSSALCCHSSSSPTGSSEQPMQCGTTTEPASLCCSESAWAFEPSPGRSWW